MKKYIRKITSITMALVVLLSTMSFTISSHFCGDELVDVSYFGKAETCGMKQCEETNTQSCSISKKNCCKDLVQVIEGQNDIKKSSFETSMFDHQFIIAFFHSYINFFEGLHNKVIPFKDYSPPLLVKDIHILDEVFLI